MKPQRTRNRRRVGVAAVSGVVAMALPATAVVEAAPPAASSSTPPPPGWAWIAGLLTPAPPESSSTSSTAPAPTTTTATSPTTTPATTSTTTTTTTVPGTTPPTEPPADGSTTTTGPGTSVPADSTTTTTTGPPTETTVVGTTVPLPPTSDPVPPTTAAPDGPTTTTAAPAPVEPTSPVPPVNVTWQQTGGGPLANRGGPGAAPPVAGRVPAVGRYATGDVDVILATIRQLESGNRYHVGPNRAGASGAYQYIRSTWAGYGGFPEAYLAPPAVQDERARRDVERILASFDGNAAMVPVMWYFPLASDDVAWMDRVPNPRGGNVLTVRQYQRRWLELFTAIRAEMTGTPEEPAAVSVLPELPAAATGAVDDGADGTSSPATAPPAPPATVPGAPEGAVSDETMTLAARSMPPAALPPHGAGSMRSITFPVLGPVTYADGWGDCRDGCARRHEGTDIIGVRMQPLLAAVDGTVTRVTYQNAGIAGAVVTITDSDGWRYNYFHLNNDTPGTDDADAAPEWQIAPRLQVGDTVRAGQVIGYMGDSGNSEGSVPHLHFEIRDPSGAARPSFWSLQAARARQACSIGIGPWSFPEPAGSDVDADADVQALSSTGVSMTEVTPMFGSGTWRIDSEGRVTATGDAALIVPSRTLRCLPGPLVPFGSDGAGWTTAVDVSIVEGTALAGADPELLAALGLRDDDPDADGSEGAGDASGADGGTAGGGRWTPVAFVDPSTGEVILAPGGPVPEPAPLLPVVHRPRSRFTPVAI